MAYAKKTTEQRFWRKVRKTDTCWLWTGKLERGYGRIMVRYGDFTGIVKAHRYSWELHYGPIPDGMDVLHRCDVRACVNPAHLFLGIQPDNMADMYAKGRYGERRGDGPRDNLGRFAR